MTTAATFRALAAIPIALVSVLILMLVFVGVIIAESLAELASAVRGK